VANIYEVSYLNCWRRRRRDGDDGPSPVILLHQRIADLAETGQRSPTRSHRARSGHAVAFAFRLQESLNYLER